MTLSHRLSSKWLTVLMVAVLVWLGRQAAVMWLGVHQARIEAERSADLSVVAARDIARQEELLDDISDPEWMAYQARLRLNYKMPDEKVVVVYKKEKSGTIASVASPSTAPVSIPFWRRWWERFRR